MADVLVVDDHCGTRETYNAILRHAGYSVTLADSGDAAVATLSGGVKPQALLLDLNLGDMTGYDVLRWMRGKGIVVPTAVLTAFRREFDPDEAIGLGAMAYADQPLLLQDLLALTRSLMAPASLHDSPERLHTRVLAGDPGALECLVAIFLKALPPRLERAFPGVPWDFAVDAAADASLEHGANPARFDPKRTSSILDFLYLIARRNLLNRLRAESALKNREARYAGEQAVLLPGDAETRCADVDLWACVIAVTIDSRERPAAELWLDDAGNDAIAGALGFGHLPSTDRRREAKRFKDRLLKRLSRYVRAHPQRPL